MTRPSFLHESINESKSQRQVVILDCCFSGAIAQGMSVKDDGSVNVQEHLGGKGSDLLCSSAGAIAVVEGTLKMRLEAIAYGSRRELLAFAIEGTIQESHEYPNHHYFAR